MTVPSPPDHPPTSSRLTSSLLTADSRRALALLAGGDLEGEDAADARALADQCPHCDGHLQGVRQGLEALRRCDPAEQAGGLWASVREGLTVAAPAAGPAFVRPARSWTPAFAVTAAALLVGLFAFGPTAGEVLPEWFEPIAPVRSVGEELEMRPAERPAARPYQSAPLRHGVYSGQPFREGTGRGTLGDPRLVVPR